MLFNIDADEGSRIHGWVVPDNPGITPSVIVAVPDREEIRVTASINRSDVVELGFHHATGVIGFSVDEELIPDLAQIQEIEILEGESRIPIYRRYQIARHLEKKLCLFDMSLMPQRRIFQRLATHFTLNYNNAQRYPLETMMGLINNFKTTSVVMTGRPNFMRLNGALRHAGYGLAALLRDPYEELAERLVFVNLLATSKASHLLMQFVSDVPALVEFARELPLNDQKAMTTKFRAATSEQRQALANPMTRALGCIVEEVPEHRHVSAALENLSTMDVVGIRTRFHDFKSILADVIGADVLEEEQPEMFDKVREARDTLMKLGIVSDLLEHDLNLYALASEAVHVGLDGL